MLPKKKKLFTRHKHGIEHHVNLEEGETVESSVSGVHHDHSGFSHFLNDPLVSLALTSFALIALLLSILEFGQSV